MASGTGIANSQDFVDDQNLGLQMGGNGKPQAYHHTRGIALDGCVDIFRNTSEINDLIKFASDLRFGHSHDRAIHEDILTTRHFRVEACADLKQRRDATFDLDVSCCWRGDT